MHTSFTRRGSASPVRLGRAWLLHSYQWDVDQPPQFDWEELGYPVATKGGASASPVRLGRAWLLHSYQRTWISLLSWTGKSLATPKLPWDVDQPPQFDFSSKYLFGLYIRIF